MAVATASGSDGGARVCSGESQGRGWVEEVSEGVPGGAWRLQPAPSGRRQAGGGVASSAVSRCPSSAYWQR